MDFTRFITPDLIEQVIGIIMLLVTTVVLPKVYQWLNLKNDDKRREIIEGALQSALKFGAAKVSTDYAALVKSPELLQELLTYAEDYAKTSVPETLGKLGVADEAIREKLEARLIDFIEALAKKQSVTEDAPGSGSLATMTLYASPQTELALGDGKPARKPRPSRAKAK